MKKLRIFEIGPLFLLAVTAVFFGLVFDGHAQSVQEWTEPVNLSMSGAATMPSMVVDNQGVIHVIWVDQFDGFKYVQSADGLTWSAPVTVNFPFSVDAEPPILISDASGVIHIFWIDDAQSLIYAQALNDSLDTPSNWRQRTGIDSQVFDFDIDLDAQGGLHAVYIKNPAPVPGSAGVFYRQFPAGGSQWTVSTLLYESAYFRSLTSENAHVRLAVPDNADDESVYIVWDDRIQKRIYFITSGDNGQTWGFVRELVAPKADQGVSIPYKANIDVLDDKVLATWLVGDTGGGCTPFSWFSFDGGESWGEQVPIFSGSAQCPESSEFIPIEPGYSSILFTAQGDISLSLWDGERWSKPEVQTGLSSVTNPVTFETLVLGCKQVATYNDRLYVVGCDQSGGGDIWFMARRLGPLEDFFPLPSEWKEDANVTTVERRLESLSSVTDHAGNVHAVWIQSPYLPNDNFVPRIEYSRWTGSEWTIPVPIITNLVTASQTLTMQIDSDQRLLLSWVNPNTEELLFSWATSERANTPLEWAIPIALPTFSKLISSPYMLVDATDRIAIAYAVTLNEERGVYIIQSVDQGATWTMPVKVFDAVTESWEMVDQPKLAVTDDGTLHILFTRYALVGGPRSVGLYYSHSADGGITWIPPEIVSEQPVQWSEIAAYQGTLHRLWQENNRLAASTNHQSSTDGGLTWNSPVRIPGDADLNSKPSIIVDWAGRIHFLQVVKQETHVFQEWVWDEERWHLLDSRNISDRNLNSPAIVESSLTMNGTIYSLVQLEGLLNDGIETLLLSMSRSLELTGLEQPSLATISTPAISPVPTQSLEPLPTTELTSPAVNLNNPEPGLNRNIIGLILLVIVVLFILVVTLPRRRKTNYSFIPGDDQKQIKTTAKD